MSVVDARSHYCKLWAEQLLSSCAASTASSLTCMSDDGVCLTSYLMSLGRLVCGGSGVGRRVVCVCQTMHAAECVNVSSAGCKVKKPETSLVELDEGNQFAFGL